MVASLREEKDFTLQHEGAIKRDRVFNSPAVLFLDYTVDRRLAATTDNNSEFQLQECVYHFFPVCLFFYINC